MTGHATHTRAAEGGTHKLRRWHVPFLPIRIDWFHIVHVYPKGDKRHVNQIHIIRDPGWRR